VADVNANIGVNIDTSDALAQLKNLQRQISAFHTSVAKSSESAGLAQRNLQKNFLNSVNAIEGFSAELKTVRTTAESFSNSLEKNKLSMREYFRFAASQSKRFGKNFGAEFSTIEKTAIERVKTLQTQYIKLGRDANGAMQSIAIRPTMLNMKDLGTQTAIAGQKQAIFNQLIKQGSTNLLNFGKNTQWAGRQLMVGFTLPLATLGITAGRVFMDMEKAAIKFKKVYGDLFTAPGESDAAMESIIELGKAYTAYGVAVSDALSMAADAAAAGFAGVDLQNQTAAALKLSVLGQLDLNKALETTISLQNAFNISSKDLATEIDFLNAVENQTVISLDDMTTAIPKVAPVVKALGGDVRDLAFFMAAMKEGGINASEGANALKSGLASLINPTQRARDMLSGFGVNLRGIIDANQGDVTGVVVDFAKALDTLDPMNRAQAIEQLFGKFQFARLSTLFANVAKDGTQASRVLELAGSSVEELAALSEGELGVSAASAMNKFLAAIENIKLALAPIGETFLQIATPIIEFGTKMLEAFNNLPDGIKKSIATVITIIGGIGPIALMTFGLINNGIANMIKFFATIRLGYLKITGQAQGVGNETQYMTQEQLEAAAAAASLDQAHAGLTQRFTAEKVAVDALRGSYEAAVAAGNRFALLNPGMMKAGSPAKFAKGGVVTVGGSGNKDTEPALLTPGEAVIPAAMVKKYQPLIEGMIAGNIPGYAKGVMLGMPKSSKSVSKGRDAGQQIYDEFLKSSYANTPPTEYGHQISPTSGHSFPIFGLGGVYQKGDKQVFVKPVLDEKAAIAEMRSNAISRQAHGLEAPEQRIVVIRDPMDVTRQRRFLALESDLDPKFINNQPMGLFNEEQYFRQLVASLLRVDKDLSGSNVFGNVVADAGPAGVFNRASGIRDYAQDLPSMEDQALINLLGIRGGAKRAFAESTLGMMAGITPEQYKARMLGEIQQVLPKLKQTIASFKLTNPTEVGVYDDMIRRLEQGLGVDWGKFHSVHSAVKVTVPKKPKAVNLAEGGIVRGPGGPKDDAIPANLSNGEAVIDAETVKKNPGIIAALFQKKKIALPGYAENNAETFSFGDGKDIELGGRLVDKTREILGELKNVTDRIEGMDEVLYQALVRLGKKINPSNLAKVLNEDPALELLRSPVIGKGRKTGSQGAVRMHAGGPIEIANIEDLRGFISADAMRILEEGNATNVRLLQNMVFGGPAAANKEKLTGTEFASALDSDQGKDAFMRYVAESGNIPPNDPDLRRFAEAVRTKLLDAGTDAVTDPMFAQIIEESLEEEIYAVGKNTAQAVKDAFAEARKYSTVSSSVGGDAGRSVKLLPNQNFSVGEGENQRQVESITTSENYRQMETPEMDDLLFDNITLEIIKARATEAGYEVGRIFAITAGQAAINAARANSPSKETVDASDSLVEGVTTTIVNAKDEVAASTEQMISPITKAQTEPRRYVTDGNVVPDPKTGRLVEQGKLDKLNASRQEAMARVSGMAAKNVAAMAQNAMKAGFALTSAAGLATMFGGEIGKVAGIVMQLSGLFTSLAIATARYMTTQNAANMMLIFTSRGVGKFGKNLFAGEKGLKGLKNAMDTTKAALAKGFPQTAAIVSKALAGIVKAIGPLGQKIFARLGFAAMSAAAAAGALAAAIAAIVAIIVGGIVAYKIARSNVQRLGDTANMSADKIDKFAELFGITARKADFAGGFTGTTADTSEKQASVETVLEMEGFEDTYKRDISGIKDASIKEAETALQALTAKLSASGFEEDAVEAIINAIAIKAGRKDLDLSFSSISFKSPEGLATVDKVAQDTMTSIEAAFAKRNIWDNLGIGELSKQVDLGASSIAAVFNALQVSFREGEISSEELLSSIGTLNESIMSLDPRMAREVVDILSQELGLGPTLEGLDNFEDKLLIINARAASIEIPEPVVRALAKASKAGASKKDLQTATKLRKELNELIVEETKALEAAKDAEEQKAIMTAAVQDAKVSIEEQITALENEGKAYDILREAGWDAASAIEAVSDATIATALAMAATEDERRGILNDLSALADMKAASDARKESAGGGGGGGGSKSPMQEALEDLGRQRTEIKNNIAAYGSLRQAGFSAAEAATVAGDATLAAALASTKVGSSQWKALVNQIRLVRVEALKTTEGLQNAFSGLKSRANEYYDILEQQIERKYSDGLKAAEKQAKALNRAIEELNDVTEDYQEQIDDIQRDIEIQFDRPIEALNEESSDLSNDLALMDRAADEITKRYDEQAEALERVNKINQRLITQQKQQIGLASALVEGDIAAAAGAMQDIRATNADGAAVSQTEMLDAAKQQELDNLRSESGLSRLEIEERQFEISQEIYHLEEEREVLLADIRVIEDEIYNIKEDQIEPLEDQLKLNEDIVQAIEDQKEAELEVIDAQRQKWEDAQQALNLSKIKAGEFNDVIKMAKQLTADVVTNWEGLEDQTRKLTIETVLLGIGGEPYDAAIVPESGSGSTSGGDRKTPPGGEVSDPNAATPPKMPEIKPFAWLEDSLVEVGSWWDTFVEQPWVKSLGAMAIGTYNMLIKPFVDWVTEEWNKFAAILDTNLFKPMRDGWDSLTKTIDENVIQPAKKMWEDLNTFVNTKITEIGEWWNNLPLVKGFNDFFAWFNKDDTMENKIRDVENWWKGVGENIGTAWENGIAWFKDLPNKIATQAGNIWTGIQGAGAWLATQGENFGTWITEDVPNAIAQGGQDVWNGIQGIGDWLGEQWTNFQTWLSELPSNIMYTAGAIWAQMHNLGDWLAEQWDAFGIWLSELPANIMAAAGAIWAHMQNIGDWLATQWTNFQTWMTVDLPAGILAWGASIWAGMQDVGAWLATQWTNFQTWMTVDLPAGILAWGASIWQGMQDVGAWLATQWENFQTWMTVDLPAGILAWGASVWSGVQDVAEWLATQWQNFRTWLTVTLPAGIAAWGASLWQGIQNIGDWLTTQWNNFRTWLTVTLPNGIVNWARDMWENLPNMLDWLADRATEIQNWFRDLPGRIAGWAGNLFQSVGDWLGTVFNNEDFQRGYDDNRNTPGGSATGGMIYRNVGGDVPGEGNTDTVPAMLTPGEYVINKRSTAKFRPILKSINAGTFGGGLSDKRYKAKEQKARDRKLEDRKIAGGVYNMKPPKFARRDFSREVHNLRPPEYSTKDFSDKVYNVPEKTQAGSNGVSMFVPQSTTATQLDNPVYNYNLSVNVNGSNANADEIANNVMGKIKRLDSQRLRKQMVG
jgi:TP901 family phage tail tape measure protein